jgi:hypothetical protein
VLSLPELQERFVAALFGGSSDSLAPWILDDSIDGEARIAIYRNNLRQGFAKTLALEFPVIERLVGTDYWRQLAREFQTEHPSRSGNLHHIGAPFAAFLRRRFGATQYAYLADVAGLEWAYQEALVAADAPPLEVAALRRIASEHYPQLVFTLHPACRLVATGYPVIRIWRANQPEVPVPETIDLGSAADLILVRRAAANIELIALPPAQFAFLQAISQSAPLAAAIDAALTVDAAFDAGQALRRCVALGVLTGAFIRACSPGKELPL